MTAMTRSNVDSPVNQIALRPNSELLAAATSERSFTIMGLLGFQCRLVDSIHAYACATKEQEADSTHDAAAVCFDSDLHAMMGCQGISDLDLSRGCPPSPLARRRPRAYH